MGVICGVVTSIIGAILVIVISIVGYVVVPGVVETTIINVSICMETVTSTTRHTSTFTNFVHQNISVAERIVFMIFYGNILYFYYTLDFRC